MQAVTKFVEEGDHIIVREQSGLSIHAIGKIANQIGHGRLQSAAVGSDPT